MHKQLIKNRDVARLLGVSMKTVARREVEADLGFPQCISIKGRKYFYAEDIVAWIERQKDMSLKAA